MKEISQAQLEALIVGRLEIQEDDQPFQIHHYSVSDTKGCNWFLEVVPPSHEGSGYRSAMELWQILRDIQQDLRQRYRLPPKDLE